MAAGVVLALLAALVYGVSDFYGAIGAERLRLVPSTAVGYAAATVVVGAALPLAGGAWSGAAVWWGLTAAVCAIIGMLAFYAAMVVGPVSLVSPLIALLESAVPVVGALLLGQRLGVVAWTGVAVAVAAGVLMSLRAVGGGGRLTLRVLGLGLVSGLALGMSIVALDRVPPGSGLVPAFVEVAGGLVVVLVVLLASRRQAAQALPRPLLSWWPALLGGALLGVANALIVSALEVGALAVVGVLVSLYPLATIVLAWLLSHERLGRLQLLGVLLALVASVLFAAG